MEHLESNSGTKIQTRVAFGSAGIGGTVCLTAVGASPVSCMDQGCHGRFLSHVEGPLL